MESGSQESLLVQTNALDRLLKNQRRVVIVAAGGIALLAALYTITGVGMPMSAVEMTSMAGRIGSPIEMAAIGNRLIAPAAWGWPYAALVFGMWWVMMIAMMVPSAAPTVLLYVALKRSGAQARQAGLLGGVFLLGYLLCWASFSVLATALQWLLEYSGLVSASMMTINSTAFAGLILVLAALYQFSAFKTACLDHCRSPAGFLTAHHRPGTRGALGMGVHHGLYCLGCCWALMALLFVGGVMNLYWIAALALYVLAEKLLPQGRRIARIAGVALLALGGYVLLQASVF